MKLTCQIQLLPDAEQAGALKATVERFNEACNWLAAEAFAAKLANKVFLQRLHYTELRSRFGLSAQMAIRCIAQVVDTYKRDKTKCPKFRKHAAMPYDERIMSFKGVDRVSLLTLSGRVRVPFVMGKYQQERFAAAKGQADLVLRKDGKWFLLVTVDVPEGAPIPVTDFIGIDLGVANIITDSDGNKHSGDQVESVRCKHHSRRKSMQKKAARAKKRGCRPKQIRYALKRAGGKESRFRRDVNHCISKSLVAQAKDTGRGLALEDLTHIRDRARFRKPQRARMAGWSFFQLRAFLDYKARLAGVPVVVVDPRYTSQTCSVCSHCEKANRPSQNVFRCRRCGHTLHADVNAARNIRAKALVNAPQVSETPQGGEEDWDKPHGFSRGWLTHQVECRVEPVSRVRWLVCIHCGAMQPVPACVDLATLPCPGKLESANP